MIAMKGFLAVSVQGLTAVSGRREHTYNIEDASTRDIQERETERERERERKRERGVE